VNDLAPKPDQSLLEQVMMRCSQLNIPVQSVLELTYRCNLRCTHCYIDNHQSDELSFEEWKEVLDQLKKAGTIFLVLTGGELTVRDDFLEIARYAYKSGFRLGFMTNCTLITPTISKALAMLKPYSIVTSLYGANSKTHEFITQVPGSFEKTLEGIKLLIGDGIVPTVQTLIMKNNLSELRQIEDLVERLGAKPLINMAMAPSKMGADYPFHNEPTEEEIVSCRWNIRGQIVFEQSGPGLCKAGKAACSISPCGDVTPCPMFPLKLGNLKQSLFETIWRLEPCTELRYLRSMTLSDLQDCNACQLRRYCRRCTGVAYLESGRANGSSPSACRQSRVRCRLSQAMEV
jgi:radical SAM protein with 4Fe4S-binding SPASM domain